MSIVQLQMMKNISVLLLSLCMAMVVVSCVEDEEIVTSPECYIVGFSVADIDTEVTIKKADGSDTVIVRTIGGDDIDFNISQVKNTIRTVDSLPNWVDLTKVNPTISSTGYVYIKQEGDTDFRPFVNGNDTVDFTKKVNFMVVATDGVSTKTYTAEMLKRIGEADSLVWTKVSGADLKLNGNHRSVVIENADTLRNDNGTVYRVADRIYVFAENGGAPTVTSSSLLTDAASWRDTISLQAGLDWQSVTAFKGHLYAMGSDGIIYKASDRGATWTAATEKAMVRLLCADNIYMYAYDGVSIVASRDLQTWTACGSADLDMLPQTCISSACYPTKTNTSLDAVVMMGLNAENTDNAVVWYKISSANESLTQDWAYVAVTEENEYPCPRFDNMSMTRYGNELWMIGGDCKAIYTSKDNGISWHLQTEKMSLPEGLGAQVSMVTAGGNLWLISSGGEVWRGEM